MIFKCHEECVVFLKMSGEGLGRDLAYEPNVLRPLGLASSGWITTVQVDAETELAWLVGPSCLA